MSKFTKWIKTFDDYWNYFLLLQSNQQYDKAIALLTTTDSTNPNDIRVQKYNEARLHQRTAR